MSATATSYDVRSALARWADSLTEMYVKDLLTLSQDQFTTSIGGKCRTPQDFTAEVIGLLGLVGRAIRGESAELPSDEVRAEFRASITTPNVAAEKLKEAVANLVTTVSSLTDEQLSEEVQAPWGQPIGKMSFANLAVNHIWYHDGQLNLIQAFNGDAEIHWM